MVRVTLHMKVQADRASDFERAWNDVAAQAASFPGSLRQSLARDLDDASSFVVTSDWATKGAFHLYERSREQDDLVAPLRELRESVTMTIHELLVHRESAPQP